MEYLDTYSALMNGIGFSLQDALTAVWFAAEADLLAYGAIVIGLFVLAWSLLTWQALNSPEARDERERLRMWTRILIGVDVTRLSEAARPPTTLDTGDDAGDDTGDDTGDGAGGTDPGRAA